MPKTPASSNVPGQAQAAGPLLLAYRTLYCMDNRSARIAALKRYISLLELEEERLSWLKSSPTASQQERTDADSNLKLTTEKITKAETELKTLEIRRLS